MFKIFLLGNAERGIYSFRRELISAFVAKGYRVVVGFPFAANPEKIRNIGCDIVDTKINRHGTSLFEEIQLALRYYKLLRQYSFDVVLTYTVKPNIYASIACQWYGVPYINNITGLGASLQGNTFLSRLVVFLQKIAYRKSSCVFFQNSENLETLLKLGVVSDTTPKRLLPGSGVNLSMNKYEQFPKSDGVIRFVTVARIQRAKGYDVLFSMAQRIKEKYPYVEFHIVGRFEEEDFKEEVERLAQANVIVYHGEIMQEEVHRWIARCNCLVHPTHHEGMSNVCLEAAAVGRPIIASDIPGCRETFEDGISGFGFKVKDADALFEVIEKFIHTPIEKQAEMGLRGRLKMEKEFDRQIVVDAYLEEIDKIAKKAS